MLPLTNQAQPQCGLINLQVEGVRILLVCNNLPFQGAPLKMLRVCEKQTVGKLLLAHLTLWIRYKVNRERRVVVVVVVVVEEERVVGGGGGRKERSK